MFSAKSFILAWTCVLMLRHCGADPGRPVSAATETAAPPSQATGWPPPSQLAFDQFTTRDGLVGNTITAIYQDKQGFLWIGSDGGLNRYDGYSFQAYRHDADNPLTLASSEVLAIGEDSRGHLWLLHPKGLSELLPDGSFARHPDTLSAKTPGTTWNVMTIDSKDRIWFQRNEGVYCFDIPRQQFTRVLDASGMTFERPGDGLYAFASICPTGADTCRQMVLRWSDSEERFISQVDSLIIYSQGGKGMGYRDATFDASGRLWFCRQDGLLLNYDFERRQYEFIEPEPGVPYRYNLGSTTFDISYSQANNALWLAGFGGVVRYDLSPGSSLPVIRYQQQDHLPSGLPVRVAQTVLEDRSGNLWVGTFQGGLCRYAPARNKFRVYRKQSCDAAGLASNKVEALCFDDKGRLWVGTDNGLSLLENPWEGQFLNFYHPPVNDVPSNPNWISDMVSDSAGQLLYLAYWGNVPNKFDTRTMRFEPLQPSNLPPDAMERWLRSPAFPFTFSIARDQQGTLLYGSYGEFMQQFDPRTGAFTFFGWADWEQAARAGLPSGLTRVVYPARNGVLWIGTDEDKGLVRANISRDRLRKHLAPYYNPLFPHFSPGDTLHLFKPHAGDSTALQGGVILDLLEDRRGWLWVATNRGLHCLRDREKGIFQHFGQKSGLPEGLVNSLVEDNHGRLWLGTNGGLYCFDPDAGRVSESYTAEDGLPDNVFLARSCARGPRGELAFGTASGLCLFHPDSLYQNRTTPALAVSLAEVNGMPRGWSPGGIALEHSEKNIALEFAVLDFGNPQANRFQYYLEGYDAGWCLPTANHRALYTSLPPGRYTFRVRGAHQDGVWSQAEIALPLRIQAPWWATWWFRTLAIAGTLALAFLLVRLREGRLLRKQGDAEKLIKYLQVQTLQAQMNPHFIFNVLGAMQNQILNSDTAEANRHLVGLAKLIRRFLESSVSSGPPGMGASLNTIPLEQEIELLRLYVEFEQLQRPDKFAYTIEVDPSVNVHNTVIPPLVIQPFVENAVKHGLLYKEGHGRLDIRFSKAGAALACTITDDGVGRENAAEIQGRSHKLYKSHGTRLVRERVDILREMGHHIDIQTEDLPGGGTCVMIKFME